MRFLLDTNVVSETIRIYPNVGVKNFLKDIPAESLYISVLTLGEIRKGIELLDDTKKKNNLIGWLEKDLKDWFDTRILSISKEVADKWGYITAQSYQHPLPAIDSLIGATALTCNLTLVTRNTKDFKIEGLEIINPWE